MAATFTPGLLSHRTPRDGAAAAETAGAIVLARGLHKTYDTGAVKTHALRGVDLRVARGETVGIMGPSGCGKTTLLNCLAGLEEFEAGEVHIDGTPLRGMSDNAKTEYRARQMGFVFQSYNLCWLRAPFHPVVDPPRRGEEFGGADSWVTHPTWRRKPKGTAAWWESGNRQKTRMVLSCKTRAIW